MQIEAGLKRLEFASPPDIYFVDGIFIVVPTSLVYEFPDSLVVNSGRFDQRIRLHRGHAQWIRVGCRAISDVLRLRIVLKRFAQE